MQTLGRTLQKLELLCQRDSIVLLQTDWSAKHRILNLFFIIYCNEPSATAETNLRNPNKKSSNTNNAEPENLSVPLSLSFFSFFFLFSFFFGVISGAQLFFFYFCNCTCLLPFSIFLLAPSLLENLMAASPKRKWISSLFHRKRSSSRNRRQETPEEESAPLPYKFPLPLSECIVSGAPTTALGNPTDLFGFTEPVLRTLEYYCVFPEHLNTPALMDLACGAMRFLGLAKFNVVEQPAKKALTPDEQEAFFGKYSGYLDPSKVGDFLGNGTYGDVYLARAPDGEEIAVKYMEHSTKSRKCRNLCEGWLLSRLDHPNIVNFRACGLVTMPFRAAEAQPLFWMATEYLEGQTLRAARKSDADLREPHLAYIAFYVLSALKSLHKNFIVHLDLKTENIMLTGSGRIKLIDFGLAEDVRVPRIVVAGSAYAMAPEIIRREPLQTSPDIWSFGVMLLELAYGVSLSELFGSALSTLIRHGSVGITPDLKFHKEPRFPLSQDFKGFLTSCLTFDAATRPRAKVLLGHPWLQIKCDSTKIRDAVDCLFVQHAFKDLGIGF